MAISSVPTSIRLLLLALLLAACSSLGSDATPTPVRPSTPEAIYHTNAGGTLQVTLSEIRLSQERETQILAVLGGGDSSPAYVLYPANQPGVTENPLWLTGYPLAVGNGDAWLWVVVLRHTAYPVSERLGQATIAGILAGGFDLMVADLPSTPLAAVVAAYPDLLTWFGEIEVIGETVLRPELGANTHQAVGFELSYEAVFVPAPTPSPTPTALATFSPAGYWQVVHETFDDAQSTVRWFIGSDSTYSANIVNGAYQIALNELEPDRNNISLSWGSIQDVIIDNYIIRIQMRVLQADVVARLGLWLHYQDDFNFLFFGIENTGRYRVARFQNGYTELAPWASSPVVQTGSAMNEMIVQLQGNIYTMILNGETLVTTSDSTFKEGRIAFFCYAETVPATCHLDEIEIWVPQDAPFPKPTATPTAQ